MDTITVDIWRRCDPKCRCSGISRIHVTAKAGDVSSTGYGFCTHAATGGNTIKATWKGQELQRIGFLHAFEDIESITTYYHAKYDGIHSFINRPLVLRVKKSPDKAYWFENAGHYLNTKWREVYYTDDYPEEDSYVRIDNFKDKLDTLACDLYGLHGVYLDYDTGYNFKCDLCFRELETKVTREEFIYGATRYLKYKHENLTNTSVLVYRGSKLTYLKKPRYTKAYYLPIPINDPSNIKNISAYYWNKDENRDNPLLIQIETGAGLTFWFENISRPEQDGKLRHDKWRLLPFKDNTLPNFHERLSALNCVFNKTVQINIGSKNCHDPQYATLHKVRVRSSYEEAQGTYPVVKFHKYESTTGNNELFNISNVAIDGKNQTIINESFPLRDIKRLLAYVSPCDNRKAFLICVEDMNNGYKWYERKDGLGNWEEQNALYNNMPKDVISRRENLLKEFETKLSIRVCNAPTSDTGIIISIKENPPLGNNTTSYKDTNGASIIVTQVRDVMVPGFFKNIHSTTRRVFPIRRKLADGNDISAGSQVIPGVENLSVHFWEGNPTQPILISLYTNNLKYYGKTSSKVNQNWINRWVEHMDRQQALDHQNCQLNNAIPIDIKNPTNLDQFKSTKNESRCIGIARNITSRGSGTLFSNDSGYIKNSYTLTPNTNISRVTYDGPNNTVFVLNKDVSEIRTYSWNGNPTIPLLVEFKPPSGDSIWYENYGLKDKTKWKFVDPSLSKDFYSKIYPQFQPTGQLIGKLNEVNCTINNAVQIQMNNRGSQQATYCHKHSHKVLVTPTSKDNKIEDLDGYEHIPTDRSNFHISSFNNDKTKQIFLKSNDQVPVNHIKDVNKVIVYFSQCDPEQGPLLAYILHENGGKKTWFRRMKKEYPKLWADVPHIKGNTPKQAAGVYLKNVLGNIKKEMDIQCGNNPKQIVMKSAKKRQKSAKFLAVPDYGGKPVQAPENASDDDDSDEYEEGNGLEGELYYILDHDIDEEFLKNEEPENEEVKKITRIILRPTPGEISEEAVQQIIAPHGVVIDIQQRITGTSETEREYKLSDNGDGIIKLVRSTETNGFVKFIHTKSDGTSFFVREVKHNNQKIADIGIRDDEEVKHLAVWYWDNDFGLSQPLLVEILKDGKYTYTSNKGGGGNNLTWQQLPRRDSESYPLQGEALEDKLDRLNCENNGAHVINISRNSGGNQYICLTTGCDSSITFVNYGTKDYSYYLHSIDSDSIRRFKDEGTEQTGINSPEGTNQVYVFHCPKGQHGIPLLAYLPESRGWYQRETLDSNNWISVINDKPSDPFTGNDVNLLKLLKAKLPIVTIDVGDTKVDRDRESTTYQDPGTVDNPETISLTKNDVLESGSKTEYTSFVHSVLKKPFVARDVKHTNLILQGIDKSFILQNVTAYYSVQGSDLSPDKLLMVCLEKRGSDQNNYAYYIRGSGGSRWIAISEKPDKLDGSELTEQLNQLKDQVDADRKKLSTRDGPGLSPVVKNALAGTAGTLITVGTIAGIVKKFWGTIATTLITSV